MTVKGTTKLSSVVSETFLWKEYNEAHVGNLKFKNFATDHNDGVRHNNRADNLRICTDKEIPDFQLEYRRTSTI
uniref:HNHc domain-containing protein n=1 Tax=Rhabditophanes sp. KR3021 TaxID=114890 RepID=A0AC35UH78_9BILA